MRFIAKQVPFTGRMKTLFWSVLILAIFNPSSVSAVSWAVQEMYQKGALLFAYYPSLTLRLHYAQWGLVGFYSLFALSRLCFPYEGAKAPAKKKGKGKPLQIKIGDMIFTEKDLFTNIMITGTIGSGKTSSAIYPILSQLLSIYNREDEERDDIKDPYQKLGGLVLDVKGDFYEALIYKMHQAKRDVLHDLIVITPWADYAYAEFQDPVTKFFFYVSGRGGGDEGSNELALLLTGKTMPDPTTLKPHPKDIIPTNMLTDERRLKQRITPNNPKTYLDYFQELTIELGSAKPKFIGWRLTGGKLRRIKQTSAFEKEEFAKDAKGNFIEIDPPRTLRFRQMKYVNNGLTFNICPPSLGPAELANRLVSMSKNASGKGSGGDNSFWDDATKKHIGWAVQMWREIKPDIEITALDINRLTGDQDYIDTQVQELRQLVDEKQQKHDSLPPGNDRDMLVDELSILKDMYAYFDGEWKSLDPKTKSNLVACITNLFGQFMSDPKLRKVFCVPSSFKLDEVMQSGKIFTLVAPEYETAARVFGTSLKMEFQAILRRRPSQAHFNKERFILFMCDEAQNYVSAGGNDNTGDENFMALSRQSKVCNIIATQSDSSIINVIGDKSSPVYYQAFGGRFWFQNTDSRTNKSAAEILGKINKDKTSKSGKDHGITSVFKEDKGGGSSTTVNSERIDRFPPETFPNLNGHQCIIYNKGQTGAKEKACKNQLSPDSIGSREEKPKKDAIIRWYFQAYIENQINALKSQEMINHVKREKTTEKKAPAPEPVTVNTSASQAPRNFNTDPTDDSHEQETEDNMQEPSSLLRNRMSGKKSPSYVEEKQDDLLTSQTVPNVAKEAMRALEVDPQTVELTKAELTAIGEKFGDATKIGLKLQQFVTIMDQTSAVNTEFERSYKETDFASFTGEEIVGEDGVFIPGDNFKEDKGKMAPSLPAEEKIADDIPIPTPDDLENLFVGDAPETPEAPEAPSAAEAGSEEDDLKDFLRK